MRLDLLKVISQRRLSVTHAAFLVAVDWDCGSPGPLLPEARPHRARQVPTMTQLSSFQYSYCRFPRSLRPSRKTHPFWRNSPRFERGSIYCARSSKANRCRVRAVWHRCRHVSALRAPKELGCQPDRSGPCRRRRGSRGSSPDCSAIEAAVP